MVMAGYALIAVLVVGAGVGIWRLLPMSTRGEMPPPPFVECPRAERASFPLLMWFCPSISFGLG